MTLSATGGEVVETAGSEPIFSAVLWPHRSMSRRGFGLILLATTAAFAIPMGALIGSAALWIVGAFVLVDIALLAGLIQLTYRSGRVRERIAIWPERLEVERTEPNGGVKSWAAHPHWVRVSVVDTERIEAYLMLSSAGRDIELGAFLTPPERRALAVSIKDALAAARAPAA
ncbi:MAG: DUF2244 domain-containing protein [Pseudomonadota bacterium]